MRKTKIVCTIGPACANEETLTRMCLAGMNVARLNFSHGTHEAHKENIELIKKVREKLHLPIAIMLDTKGPEYRIKTFKEGKIFLNEGDTFIFTTDEVEGDQERVSVSYKGMARELQPGDQILLNNGLLTFEVRETRGNDVITEVLVGGELSDRKSMAFPGKVLKQVYLSEQDKADIKFGVENDVDFIACSFVSIAQDVIDVKNYLDELGADDIDLICKIENRSGVENIEEICANCDGILIGRGDMGVEIPYEEVPAIQKHLISQCRMLGKRVITATEMLESMTHNIRPTRAEISDVANAVYDGTSAIMLSGETAAGDHPVEALEAMAKIARETEHRIDYTTRFHNNSFKIRNTVDAISHAVCGMAIDIEAQGIAVCSLSGKTVRMVSRFRSPMPILGLTTSEKTWRKLGMSWGVTPVMVERYNSTDVLFYEATKEARRVLGLKPGDKVVITGGMTNGVSGNTNLIKCERLG
mgnify:FL=1